MEAVEITTVEHGGATYRITFYPDHDAESPASWGGWRLISYGRRHLAYEHPQQTCKGLDAAGRPIPATIGFARKLERGTAFWLSYYEHGLCRWSLMGEGPQCRWDTTRIAGLLLWEQAAAALPRDYAEREASARAFLDIYTAWANGDVYGYDIERLDADPNVAEALDSCFGFYGVEPCVTAAKEFITTIITEDTP